MQAFRALRSADGGPTDMFTERQYARSSPFVLFAC